MKLQLVACSQPVLTRHLKVLLAICTLIPSDVNVSNHRTTRSMPLLSLPPFILTEVFQYLHPENATWSPRRTAKDLISLATTCQYLSELALSVLWSALPGLYPILWTMPAGLWTVIPHGNGATQNGRIVWKVVRSMFASRQKLRRYHSLCHYKGIATSCGSSRLQPLSPVRSESEDNRQPPSRPLSWNALYLPRT